MSSRAALGSAIFYGACSFSLNFLNKAVVSVYAFDHPLAIMICQTVFTILVLELLRLSGAFSAATLQGYAWKDGEFKYLQASLKMNCCCRYTPREFVLRNSILKTSCTHYSTGRTLMPASLAYAMHSTVGLCALEGMNIPMYGAVKRCTPLASLVLSVVILKKPIPSR